MFLVIPKENTMIYLMPESAPATKIELTSKVIDNLHVFELNREIPNGKYSLKAKGDFKKEIEIHLDIRKNEIEVLQRK